MSNDLSSPIVKWGGGCIIGFVLLLFLAFAIDSVTSTRSTPPTTITAAPSAPISSAPAMPSAPSAPPLNTFDVPALVGLSIDGIKTVLGPASNDMETKPANEIPQGFLNDPEWDKSWDKGKASLNVLYNHDTRKVIDFFVGADDPSGGTSDKTRLLQLAQAQENAPNYRIEYVEAGGHPGQYTGVKIIPR